jgi:hypothetical protein
VSRGGPGNTLLLPEHEQAALLSPADLLEEVEGGAVAQEEFQRFVLGIEGRDPGRALRRRLLGGISRRGGRTSIGRSKIEFDFAPGGIELPRRPRGRER